MRSRVTSRPFRRVRGNSITVLVLALALAPLLVQAQRGAFPLPLRFDAEDLGCVPVQDTLAFSGLEDPLWRFGVPGIVRGAADTTTAAYWCSMPTGPSETSLVVWRLELREAPLPGGCSRIIPYRGRPGGLRFERRGEMALQDAYAVDEIGRKGPRVTARGTVFVSTNETRTVRFICHTGRWWMIERAAPAPSGASLSRAHVLAPFEPRRDQGSRGTHFPRRFTR